MKPEEQIESLAWLDGWKRATDVHKCGSIDWTKEFCGCLLIIKSAELISPKLIKEVKI